MLAPAHEVDRDAQLSRSEREPAKKLYVEVLLEQKFEKPQGLHAVLRELLPAQLLSTAYSRSKGPCFTCEVVNVMQHGKWWYSARGTIDLG